MRMQMKATSFVADRRRGQVDVTIGGEHQGEPVTLSMRFPVNADANLTKDQLLDAAWLRAQQILRCATLVMRPVGRLDGVERPTNLRSKPVHLSLVPQVGPSSIETPIDASLWF